jgi:UDP-N-acetyl-D-mannosaminuronate dehydrogenase
VPLFIDETNNPDFSILELAIRAIGKILKKGDLVVLETTVPPMTTETLVRKWLEEESRLSLRLIEGCYRDVNIGLANELFKMSNELGIDFYEAREYANHEYCHIHLPSTGVGGHCIPLYPWFVIKEMEKREKFSYTRLLRTAREQNDEMVEYWAEKIVLECLRIDKPLNELKICVILWFAKQIRFSFSTNLSLEKNALPKKLIFLVKVFFVKRKSVPISKRRAANARTISHLLPIRQAEYILSACLSCLVGLPLPQ